MLPCALPLIIFAALERRDRKQRDTKGYATDEKSQGAFLMNTLITPCVTMPSKQLLYQYVLFMTKGTFEAKARRFKSHANITLLA